MEVPSPESTWPTEGNISMRGRPVLATRHYAPQCLACTAGAAHSFLAAAQERRLRSHRGRYLVQFQASSGRQLARLPLAAVAAYRVLEYFESQAVSLPPTMALWLLNVVGPM